MKEVESAPAYYAIIPASVRYDKTLTANAKLLYGEITALCNEKGYCWASNAYFARLYSMSRIQTISEWISALSKAGYIDVVIDSNTHQERKIYMTEPLRKNVTPLTEKRNPPLTEKRKHNNTTTNTTYKLPSTKPKDFTYAVEFEELWKLHNIGDKWAGYKAWNQRHNDYSKDDLAKALIVESKKQFGKRHFATVLNGDIDEAIAVNNNAPSKAVRYV